MEGLGVTLEFWKNRRVLMTGHTGFKGAWLSLRLQKLGALVIGYSLDPPTEPNIFQVADVEEGMVSISGDVRNLAHLDSVCREHNPEIVIHMAAQSLVRQSYVDPVETYETNVMGTVHVLEAARRCESVKAVLIVTSDKCYENQEWLWPYRENEPLGGHDPYSSSKACAELVSAAYRSSFFSPEHAAESALPVATVRAGNVIGGGDWALDRLVPDCIRACVEGRPVQLRYPRSIRPWQHVLEPLAGYMELVERLCGDDCQAFAEAWNFGPDVNDHATVGELSKRVVELWGTGSVNVSEEADRPHEAGLLRLDVTKALTRLDWRPRWTLDRAIQETVSWYKAWAGDEDMREFTLKQISSYEEESP